MKGIFGLFTYFSQLDRDGSGYLEKDEIECKYLYFRSLPGPTSGISRSYFRSFPDLTSGLFPAILPVRRLQISVEVTVELPVILPVGVFRNNILQ